jgi:putative DNA primase/helicase
MIYNHPTEQELEDALKEAGLGVETLEKSFEDKGAKAAALHKFSKFLIDRYHIKTAAGKKREMFAYKEGIYIDGEDIVKKDIRESLEELCSIHTVKEVIETIKDLTSTDRENFKANLNLINLNNGVYDIYTGELLPHDPKHLFFTKIPIDFNPGADCPVVKKYLSEVLEENQTAVVQEWFGYILYREYFIKKALICVGDGDTGKTTLITLMSAFVGEKNISSVSLQKITYDKFAASNLYNRHLNQYDDLSAKDIEDNGAFKMATGNGLIPGEKKFGDQFSFKNYAKLTFTCNKIPDVKDTNDDAYFNRWIVLQFTRIIEADKKDTQLIHKMTTPEELSGLLNFALEGLKRLVQNEKFSYDKDTHEIKTEMMRSASSIALFESDCLEEATGNWVSKENMYHAYTNYTSENKIPAVSMKAFGGRLPMCASYIAESKPKDPNDPKGKKQITAWRNVRLKQKEPDVSTEDIDRFVELFPDDPKHE